ncbi:uncharacterized protein LOC113870790 [Abrus precatorius]|uniref:Uncharacterized protein LOC113870790 n=1 Tax=Abrus precatorius TaxID=3816 RepID=A0A8B8M3E1_ABRPR|nr:uncharacterized protein LOC113870790 [Abrus precatorius]
MAVNSAQIDLNSDAVLFDRENEVMGLKSLGSNVSVGVSHSETLSGDPIGGGEVLVHYQACHVGDDRDVNGSQEQLSGVNKDCDVMIDDGGKKGLGEGSELVGIGNGLGAGVEVVDGGCDGKAGEFSCELVENGDKESGMECLDGAPFACGDAEPDKGLVFEFDDCVWNELGCENAREVTENGLPSTEVASNNVAQGVDNNVTGCDKEVKNAALVNMSAAVEDDGEMNATDSLVVKDRHEDLCASEVATCQLLGGIPYMEETDVDDRESLPVEDLSRNHLELETSYELKQPTFQVDAQVDVLHNQTIGIDISEAQLFENIQNECHGFNLVVDLNSYRNLQEIGIYREPVFSGLDFCVSDLVWGKVMGHPWWPGQVFDSSAASEKAKRHLKEDSYLIAYFGDQTFAWNDVSMIKPFHMHFPQMEKQSNLENFHHAIDCALDEVSRRVEFGLSCPCMPEEVFSQLKTQVISNAGIRKQSSRRNGGDRYINAASFEPMKLISFIKSLAQSPFTESDRLDFVIARAQLLAFYRSKGYSQLAEFAVLGGLFETDMEILHEREKEQCNYQVDEQEVKICNCYSQKHNHISWDSKQDSKKHKLLSDLMCEKSFCIPNGECTTESKGSDNSTPQRRGRKRKTAYNTLEYFHNSRKRKCIQLQHVSTNEMWSQLCLAAKDPAGESHSNDMVDFFAEFKKSSSLDYSASLDQIVSLEQMREGETRDALGFMTPAMQPCNDSYWTDRIIQSISEEQSLSKYQNEGADFLHETPGEANSLSFKSQPAAEMTTNLGFEQQDADRNLGLEPSKLVEHLDESSKEGICLTALTLKFTSLDSVPSTTDLNKIFGRFGPLIESKTELLERTNRARVVFQRRSDAENAFSSAGKYSIFGPSLVSYRLKILPPRQQKGTGKRGRKSKKEKSSVNGTAV